MEALPTPASLCPHCGHDNRIRTNGMGALSETLLNGQYQVGRVLGRGGFGITYIGYDLNLRRKVAIKEYFPSHLAMRGQGESVLSAITGSEEDYRQGCQRALKESQMAAVLGQISGVVQVYNVLTANNTIYIIMEYVAGETLSGYVATHGPQTPQAACTLLRPVAQALMTIHRKQVVHRDVKPDNIMIRAEDEQGVLLDFGAARIASDSTMSYSAAVVSQGYTPVEQYNQTSMDGRIDQYALAATLMFTLTGQRPPDVMQRMAQSDAMPSLRSLNPAVTPAVESVILKGMALHADDRYPSVDDLWNALESALQGPKKTPASSASSTSSSGLTKAVAVFASLALVGCLVHIAISGKQATPASLPEDSPVVSAQPTATTPPILLGSFACHQLPEGYAIARYLGNSTEVIIPDTLDGQPVVAITAEAFADGSYLTGIHIPASVTHIDEQAFAHCQGVLFTVEKGSAGEAYVAAHNLPATCENWFRYTPARNGTATVVQYDGLGTHVIMPDSLSGYQISAIADSAFAGADHLQQLHLPDGITKIDANAFENCTSLTTLSLPESLTSMGSSAFENCSALASIALPDGLTTLPDRAFTSCSSLSYLQWPAGLTQLGTSAFEHCTSLTSVSLPETVTTIGDLAFASCTRLMEITLPSGLTTLGNDALANCAFTFIELPDSLTTLGDRTFADCFSLTSVTLPDGLTEIGQDAFANCAVLTAVNLPETLVHIGDRAFQYCASLTDVTLPDSLVTIGWDAFDGCPQLVLYASPDSAGHRYAQDMGLPCQLPEAPQEDFITRQISAQEVAITGYRGNGGHVVVPGQINGQQVIHIGGSAFQGNRTLTGITLPEGVTAIEKEAFAFCDRLSQVTLPASLITIGPSAFDGCINLRDLILPASLTHIYEDAFQNCPNLILTVPEDSYAHQYVSSQGLSFRCP